MKTQYYTASSLDRFIAGPNDSLDWLFPLGDVDETSYPEFIGEVGALAMGSATYERMLRHLVGSDPPQPWSYEQPTETRFGSRNHDTTGTTGRHAGSGPSRGHRPCLG